MKLFGFAEAAYYCSSFTAEPGDAEGSLDSFIRNNLGSQRIIREGSPLFVAYRSCALRESERLLFLAISQYRRCLDLLIPSSSPWSHVTMYYGCFFAAKSILGMFGSVIFNNFVVDVHRSSPSSQELVKRRIGNRVGDVQTTYTGSHKRFWDIFYRAVSPIRPFVVPSVSFAFSPISNNPTWLIDRRNEINYDAYEALHHADIFSTQFSAKSFPASLPGMLGTQYALLESFIEIASTFARQLSLRTDALKSFSSSGSISSIVRDSIFYQKIPSLVSKSKKVTIMRALK